MITWYRRGVSASGFLQGQPAVIAMLDHFDPPWLRLPELGQGFEERDDLRRLPIQRLVQIIDLESLGTDRALAAARPALRVIESHPC